MSERTRLSRTAMTLIAELTRNLLDRFEILANDFIPSVLKLCTRANKVFVHTANATLKNAIEYSGIPNQIPAFTDGLRNPSKTLRLCAAEAVLKSMQINSPVRLEPYVDHIETAIKDAILDSTPEVRETARAIHEQYRDMFANRLDRFHQNLPEVAKKYLKINSKDSVRRGPTRTLTERNRGPLREKNKDDVEGARDASLSPSYSVPRSKSSLSFFEEQPSSSTRIPAVPDGHAVQRARTTSAALNQPSTLTSHVPLSRRLFDKPTRVHHQPDMSASIGNISQSEHMGGGAQRVLREDKPPAPPTFGHTGTTRSRPIRIPAPSAASVEAAGGASSSYRARASPVEGLVHPPRSQSVLEGPVTERVVAAAERLKDKRSLNRRSTTMTTNGMTSAKRYEAGASGSSSRSDSANNLNASGSNVTTSTALDEEIQSCLTKSRSSDWATRSRAFEDFGIILASVPGPLLRSNGRAIIDLLAIGLQDQHYKVLQFASGALAQLLLKFETSPDPFGGASSVVVQSGSCGLAPQEIAEHLLPRLAAIVYQPARSLKPGVRETGLHALTLFKDRYRGEPIFSAVVVALNSPEFAKNTKAKTGCITLLSDMTPTDWTPFLIKTSTKSNPSLYEEYADDVVPGSPDSKSEPGKSPRLFDSGLTYHGVLASGAAKSPKKEGAGVRSVMDDGDASEGIGAREETPVPNHLFERTPGGMVGAHTGVGPSERTESPDSIETRVDLIRDVDEPVEDVSVPLFGIGVTNSKKVTVEGEQLLDIGEELSKDADTDGMLVVPHVTAAEASDLNSTRETSPVESDLEPVIVEEENVVVVNGHSNGREEEEVIAEERDFAADHEHEREEELAVVEIEYDQNVETAESSPAPIRKAEVNGAQVVPPSPLSIVDVSELSTSDGGVSAVEVPDDLPAKAPESPTPIPDAFFTTQSPVNSPSLPSISLHPTMTTRGGADKKQQSAWDHHGLLSPHVLRQVLKSPGEENVMMEELAYESEDVQANSFGFPFGGKPNAFNAVLDATRTRRGSVWEEKSDKVVDTTIECLRNSEKSAGTVKNTLVLIRELLQNQTHLVEPRAADILFGVLNSETIEGCTTEDVLEIAYEIDAVLEAFERCLPPRTVLRASRAALNEGIGHRVCFEMMARLIDPDSVGPRNPAGAGRKNSTPPIPLELDGNKGTQGQNGVLGLSSIPDDDVEWDWEGIIDHTVKGLGSRKSATRKAAFDCAYAICRRKGATYANLLYSKVEAELGSAREKVVRGMMERKLEFGSLIA
ncbi:hypothetical protein HK102_010339 [Quaeritorhiza haematococci]|nr:hypothetical protein HK102_010339 [Quaeritorhiza haematococci]